MTEKRIRRWFRFGILDLLLLMAVVSVVMVLWRPPRPPQIEAHYEPLAQGTKPGQQWAGNVLQMKFCWCPPGEFMMGSPTDEFQREHGEGPGPRDH